MKRTIFTKSTTALILTLLVLGAFFPKELSQKLMAGAIILWLATQLSSSSSMTGWMPRLS